MRIDQSLDFNTCLFNLFPYYPTAEINPVAEFYAPLIWADAVLFHVTLLTSVQHLESIKPSPGPSHLPRLMSEALRLLQERVNGGSEARLSDETLASVAGLAAVEVRWVIMQTWQTAIANSYTA